MQVFKSFLASIKNIYNNSINANLKSSLTTAAGVVEYMHENNLHQLLPTVYDVATTLATIPATVCSSERSFIGLRRRND